MLCSPDVKRKMLLVAIDCKITGKGLGEPFGWKTWEIGLETASPQGLARPHPKSKYSCYANQRLVGDNGGKEAIYFFLSALL